MDLTADELRERLHYNPETGVFTWRRDVGSRGKAGAVVGCPDKNGYLRVRINNQLMLLHRVAFLYVTGCWPDGDVDHRNGCTSDNRWENLRVVDHKTNMQNRRRARKGNVSGLIGAMKARTPGRWRSFIRVEGRYVSLGMFDDPESAHAAYIAAKRQFHEGNTL